MKINKSVEQGVYVACILALQKDHTVVKSQVLSRLLNVSDSYLKKILAKMSKANLITSIANKAGGYKLARPATQITVYNVFSALDEDKNVLNFQHLADNIFDDLDNAHQSEKKVHDAFEKGFDLLYAELKKLKISDLLVQEYVANGYKDWNAN